MARSGASSRATGAVIALSFLLTAASLAAQEMPPLAQPAAQPPADSMDAAAVSVVLAEYRGAEAARFASTSRWVFGGFVGGLTLGPVGAGLTWTLAKSSEAEVPIERWRMLTQEGGVEYADAYQRSYARTLNERRKRAALKGGILGTAAMAVTASAIWAVYYYY